MYPLIKTTFLVYCFLPQSRGANFIYHNVVEPFLNKYETQIDQKADEIRESFDTIASEAQRAFVEHATAAATESQSPSAPPGPDTDQI
jgi:TB2/DP1, HVA22 family